MKITSEQMITKAIIVVFVRRNWNDFVDFAIVFDANFHVKLKQCETKANTENAEQKKSIERANEFNKISLFVWFWL